MCHWPKAWILPHQIQPQVVKRTRTTLAQPPARAPIRSCSSHRTTSHQFHTVPISVTPTTLSPHLSLIQTKTQACNSSRPSPTCTSSSQGLLCPGSTKAQPTPLTRASSANSMQLGQPRALALKLMQPRGPLDCLGLDRGTLQLDQSGNHRPVLKTAQQPVLDQLKTRSSALPPVKESLALDLIQPRADRRTPATLTRLELLQTGRLACLSYRRVDLSWTRCRSWGLASWVRGL